MLTELWKPELQSFFARFFLLCSFTCASHSFCDAALRVTLHLQWRHTDLCAHMPRAARPLHPVSFKGMKTGITISPAWAFIPVAAWCPAQTLPSEQTRLHWWTEAGLFTPRVKVLWGWLWLSARRRNFGDEMQLSGIWGDYMKTRFTVSVNFKVAVGQWQKQFIEDFQWISALYLSSHSCLRHIMFVFNTFHL